MLYVLYVCARVCVRACACVRACILQLFQPTISHGLVRRKVHKGRKGRQRSQGVFIINNNPQPHPAPSILVGTWREILKSEWTGSQLVMWASQCRLLCFHPGEWTNRGSVGVRGWVGCLWENSIEPHREPSRSR